MPSCAVELACVEVSVLFDMKLMSERTISLFVPWSVCVYVRTVEVVFETVICAICALELLSGG